MTDFEDGSDDDLTRNSNDPSAKATMNRRQRQAMLDSIPYDGGAIEINHSAGEITFLGSPDQPDFGELTVTIYPHERVPELKSMKQYFYSWRNVHVSYERFVDEVFRDFMDVYQPVRLRLVFVTKVRGGISSRLVADSDWTARGGKEEFKDWNQ